MNDCNNKKTIYLIRHGESTFNSTGREDTDCNLTEKGRKQSNKLGERLKNTIFDFLIVSPLRRAQQTFQHAKINYKEKETNYLCREYKETKSDFLDGEEFLPESTEELRVRCESFISYLKTLDHSLIGVVCHCTFIYNLLDIHQNCGRWIDNTEYVIIYL